MPTQQADHQQDKAGEEGKGCSKEHYGQVKLLRHCQLYDLWINYSLAALINCRAIQILERDNDNKKTLTRMKAMEIKQLAEKLKKLGQKFALLGKSNFKFYALGRTQRGWLLSHTA